MLSQRYQYYCQEKLSKPILKQTHILGALLLFRVNINPLFFLFHFLDYEWWLEKWHTACLSNFLFINEQRIISTSSCALYNLNTLFLPRQLSLEIPPPSWRTLVTLILREVLLFSFLLSRIIKAFNLFEVSPTFYKAVVWSSRWDFLKDCSSLLAKSFHFSVPQYIFP